MKSPRFIFLAFLFLISPNFYSQEAKPYKIYTVAFYNLENLFDTINDPLKYDEASPIMKLKIAKSPVYHKKAQHLARVIADIGYKDTRNTPAIIGIAEVENRKVIEQVINDSLLVAKNYGIIHFDSPDIRGIDVALLYQKALFKPINSSKHELKLYNSKNRRIYTRDQLLVSGILDQELIHIIVNHWPSRRGGEARSRPKRLAAAKLNKYIIDSLLSIDPYAKIISLGDFNDNPNDKSFKKILNTKKDKTKLGLKGIYNPFEKLYKKGLGTTAYRDGWSLFDQILLTKPWLDSTADSLKLYKAGIFNKNYLVQKRGKYKGYPFRSFSNGSFTKGYSDHFPVYIYLIKEMTNTK